MILVLGAAEDGSGRRRTFLYWVQRSSRRRAHRCCPRRVGSPADLMNLRACQKEAIHSADGDGDAAATQDRPIGRGRNRRGGNCDRCDRLRAQRHQIGAAGHGHVAEGPRAEHHRTEQPDAEVVEGNRSHIRCDRVTIRGGDHRRLAHRDRTTGRPAQSAGPTAAPTERYARSAPGTSTPARSTRQQV
jgi:hypothetical protein